MKRNAKRSIAQKKSPAEVLLDQLGPIDKKLIRKNVKLSGDLGKILRDASPHSTEYLLSGIAVDLADFWEIGIEHRRRLQELSGMKFPKDKDRFIDMLYEFEIRLVMHAEYHARLLKRRLTRLKRDLKLI
jgi:hypothetical protein